jgi:membrane protease YdiL (CAAX protease family)
MIKEYRGVTLVLANLLFLVVLLSIGGYLLVYRPEYEVLGGIILSLTQAIVGIILPYHLKRTNIIGYRFFPRKDEVLKSLILTVVFTLSLLAAGYSSISKLITSPPQLLPAIYTFLFLGLTATMYGLIFWGGLLHAFKDRYGPIVGILLTGLLFSAYHFSEFAFTPITFGFLFPMFISGCVCSLFTVISGSVLPALIAQQFGQFVYFLTLEDNPYAEPMGLVFSLIFLVVCFAVYSLVWEKWEKRAPSMGQE